MNKHELTAKLLSERARLDAALSRIDEERMPLIILYGEWSVKDLIGHLGYWENILIALFSTLRAGKTPEPFPELDAINARVLADSRKQSLSEVRRQEKTAYQKILALLEDATDHELFDAAHFAWTKGKPFENFIADNTFGHYEEHLPELLAWLKRKS
ncbi:MAG: ClbS/DfsB family four-helix bundle protein [Chloroflexi bacterium]|nr:ClbS/DfsB family four-helix bundle protein [Chloroflexota bacterium]